MLGTETTFNFDLFDLLQLVVLIAGIVGVYFRHDKRISLNQASIEHNATEIKRIDKNIDAKLDQIFNELKDLSATVSEMKGQHNAPH